MMCTSTELIKNHPTINIQTYPGQDLSLTQLVFALNEELKRAAYSPSFTFDTVSQLDQDASTALSTIREWRNSFIPINRVPLDVLSLIPTYLPFQKDCIRASSVCRHWRRTFLQCADLWNILYLHKGEDYVQTLLERSQGSPLDVFVTRGVPVSTIALLSPHTRRISSLDFVCNELFDIQRFSLASPGPLSLLYALSIDTVVEDSLDGFDRTPPSPPLFSNAANLKVFCLSSCSERSPFLSHFVFPNLVECELSARPMEGTGFNASQLFDFLEASPMLRIVWMRIVAYISFEGVPQGRIVVLPNVEDFTLSMTDGGPGYRIAAHLSCPSAKSTSLMHEGHANAIPEEIFPSSVSLNAIVHQYTKRPVEGVLLKIRFGYPIICKLTFRSSDTTIIQLCFKVAEEHQDRFEFRMPSEEMYNEVLTQATRTVQDHPQLSGVRRLHVCNGFPVPPSAWLPHIASETGRLLKSVGPLDELVVYGCDLRPYLNLLSDPQEGQTEELVMLPPIKELTISHPVHLYEVECAAILSLVKSRHTLGIPFERVIIRGEGTPPEMGVEQGAVQYILTTHGYSNLT